MHQKRLREQEISNAVQAAIQSIHLPITASEDEIQPSSKKPKKEEKKAEIKIATEQINTVKDKKEEKQIIESKVNPQQLTPCEMTIQKDSIVMCCGQVESGKSHMMRYLVLLIWEPFEIDYILILTRTPHNGFWDTIFKKEEEKKDGNEQKEKKKSKAEQCIRQYSDEMLSEYLDWLKKQKEENKTQNSILVLEDCMGSLKSTKVVEELVCNYRHFGIKAIFVATQYINRVPTVLKEQTKYAVIFQHYSANALEGLYNAFGSNYRKQDQFEAKLTQCCDEDHACMFVDVTKRTSNPDLKYLRFIADPYNGETVD